MTCLRVYEVKYVPVKKTENEIPPPGHTQTNSISKSHFSMHTDTHKPF